MIAEPRRTGLLGELRAAQYLRQKGYNIWSANYRTKVGEIDLVASVGETLCFIEVKTRRQGGYFPPAEAVDYKKEENVKSAAASYMSVAKVKMPFRFDIIEVVLIDDDNCRIRHLENAF